MRWKAYYWVYMSKGLIGTGSCRRNRQWRLESVLQKRILGSADFLCDTRVGYWIEQKVLVK